MGKGTRLAVGEKSEVYSTKILPSLKQLLAAQAHIMGPGSSQRQLLEEMHKAYAEKYPERASQAIEILAKDYPNALEMVSSYLGEIHAADATLPAEVELPRNLVQTVRYIGRPQIHLYEHDSKNGTGCSLAGTIDQESITWQSVDAVDCKKCRYCRKAVFEVGPQ